MKKTLQDQYLLIKEGKGHVGVFLTEAKRQFPNIVRNAATFDEAVASLKTKNIISENVISVMPAIMDRPKKESYETAFENFLAEVKKQNEDEKVKAEEKKVSKPVEKDLEKNFDYSDEKNPDNMIFDQIMTGYYAEMKDPKNADKTMQQLKDIVFKNLEKDPIYYTKNGQFGIKDLGYVTEAPGLGEPKEAKGKYKSSGYGDLKESKELESSLITKLMQLGVSVNVALSILKTKGIPGLKAEIADREAGKIAEGEEYYDGDDNEEVKDVRDMSWTKGFTKEEQTLREVIREMIAEELTQYSPSTPQQSLRESVEKDLADINKEAEHEVLQAKLDKIDALIDHRRSKLSKLDEDEDMKALTDKKKVKELEKDIKKLEVARKKVEKLMSKFKGKKAASKEVIDETDTIEEETPGYIKNANERLKAGESIDSIMSNYPNLSDEDQENLRNYLEWEKNSDIGQSGELDTEEEN